MLFQELKVFISSFDPKSHCIPIDARLNTRGAIVAIQLLLHMIQHLQSFELKWLVLLAGSDGQVLTMMLSAMPNLKAVRRSVIDPVIRAESLSGSSSSASNVWSGASP
jgi:hypothetical protein